METPPHDNESDLELTVVPRAGHTEAQVDHLPGTVEQYYRDAIKVMQAGVPDAAAVQLRRTLEAAAAQKGVTERNLVSSIEKLIEHGEVTRGFGAALHLVRQVGNQGAHYTDTRLDAETVNRALMFTTALLRNLFEIPEELRRALDDDSGSATPAPSP